ncbi:MAG: N-acetylmuramoyl-L-alanine amidase [Xenococcaceae cyanobacterium MO_207.B15]|nr:N-acetylmuramoyl-L-alanine amidase [Xenococcaceae cyanobacterium MO_207.B15]
MKLHWLLSSILGVFLYCSPAYAGKLLSWEFNNRENRLEFLTDEGVQPRAKLISNPTRLVIELPGTILDRTTVRETYNGAIRGFRIGQSTDDTVSLVVELAPGYILDPQQVKFRGISPTQWTVELPTPRISSTPQATTEIASPSPTPTVKVPPKITPLPTTPRTVTLPPTRTITPPPTTPRTVTLPPTNNTSTATLVAQTSPYIRATSHGFFIDINGDRSKKIRFSRSGSKINFDLEDTTLPQDLASKTVAVNQYGVQEIQFSQTNSNDARISLKVTENAPDWLATYSRIRGLLLVPRGNTSNIARNRNSITVPSSSPTPRPRPLNSNQTTVQGLELSNNDTQLLIKSDRSLIARSNALGNGVYEIRINNAQLADPFQGPQLKAGSPVTRLTVRQDGSSVLILVTTRLGVRLGNINQKANNLISLPIQSNRQATTLSPITVPPPTPAQNKPLVIIDPGHGGQDPGTIGIGGVREKDIILPISLDVAEELRKQGVEVRMTRDRDYFVSLQGRTDLANKIDADLFVSIHANAINLSRPDVNGLETYYYQNGRRLAEVIHWNILNSVPIRNRNVRRARFFVLRHSTMPAVLVEVGFLTGAEDSVRLKNPNHRRQIAKAIARGIVQYIKEKKL